MNMQSKIRGNAKTLADKASQTFESGDKNTLPYYGLSSKGDNNRSMEVRILTDANPENPEVWYVNDTYHMLDVGWKKKDGNYVTDSSGNKIPERKFVACHKARGADRCPVCEKANSIYKNVADETLKKALYGKFKKKESYIAQVLVVNIPDIDSMKYKEEGQDGKEGKLVSRVNQINLFKFGKKLLNNITSALNDADFWDALVKETKNPDVIPFGFGNNYNYVIKKTEDSNYASYDTSGFTRSFKTVESPADVKLFDLTQQQRKLIPFDELESIVEQSYDFLTNEGGTTNFGSHNETIDETGAVDPVAAVTAPAQTKPADTPAPSSPNNSIDIDMLKGLSPEVLAELQRLNQQS